MEAVAQPPGVRPARSRDRRLTATQPAGAEGESLNAMAADIDFSHEHPLRREWVMWYDNPGERNQLPRCGAEASVCS